MLGHYACGARTPNKYSLEPSLSFHQRAAQDLGRAGQGLASGVRCLPRVEAPCRTYLPFSAETGLGPCTAHGCGKIDPACPTPLARQLGLRLACLGATTWCSTSGRFLGGRSWCWMVVAHAGLELVVAASESVSASGALGGRRYGRPCLLRTWQVDLLTS